VRLKVNHSAIQTCLGSFITRKKYNLKFKDHKDRTPPQPYYHVMWIFQPKKISQVALLQLTSSSTYLAAFGKMPSITFDEVLGLEEQFYHDGLQQGLADGVKAGRIEGRTFGLEKGFEKYVESGRLYGKSLVWRNRILGSQSSLAAKDRHQRASNSVSNLDDAKKTVGDALPTLPQNQRLSKHLRVLHALSESESLTTENTEEAVSDFDDRLKRAKGKAKIIERMVGESREELDDGVGLIGIPSTIEHS
jgi:Essential protein Yae1, N terminal